MGSVCAWIGVASDESGIADALRHGRARDRATRRRARKGVSLSLMAVIYVFEVIGVIAAHAALANGEADQLKNAPKTRTCSSPSLEPQIQSFSNHTGLNTHQAT